MYLSNKRHEEIIKDDFEGQYSSGNGEISFEFIQSTFQSRLPK